MNQENISTTFLQHNDFNRGSNNVHKYATIATILTLIVHVTEYIT